MRTNKGTLYTGITNNIEVRLKSHRTKKGAKYLRSFVSIDLVYKEMAASKSEALKREIVIKKMSKIKKEILVNSNHL